MTTLCSGVVVMCIWAAAGAQNTSLSADLADATDKEQAIAGANSPAARAVVPARPMGAHRAGTDDRGIDPITELANRPQAVGRSARLPALAQVRGDVAGKEDGRATGSDPTVPPGRTVGVAGQRLSRARVPWYRGGMAALGAVLALIGVTTWVVRRLVPQVRALNGSSMRIVARTFLSPKQSLALVHVGRRLILIGQSSDRIDMLSDVDDPQEVREILAGANLEAALPATSHSSDADGESPGAIRRPSGEEVGERFAGLLRDETARFGTDDGEDASRSLTALALLDETRNHLRQLARRIQGLHSRQGA